MTSADDTGGPQSAVDLRPVPAPGWLVRLVRRPRSRPANELVRFALTGLTAFAADVLVFNLALLGLRTSPLAAKALSSVVAIAVAFVGSRYYTWPDGPTMGTWRAVATFVAISVAAALVQATCLWASHHLLRLTSPWADNISANVIGMGLATGLRFWAFRRFVFPPEHLAGTPSGQQTRSRR